MSKRKDSKGRVLKQGEYEKKSGGYEYKWTDKRGKRHSKFSPSLEGLREIKDDIMRDTLTGKNQYGNHTTLNDVYYRWLDIKRGLRKNTLRNYRYMFERFVEPEFGKTKISDLTRSEIRAFYNSLADEQRLKVSTIDSIHTVLHQLLEVAIDDDILRYNPADNALKELKQSNKHEVKKRKALTISEQLVLEEFLSISKEYSRWYPVFTTMLWTGLRVGEITGLRWEDIDMDKNMIYINHTLVYGPIEDRGYCEYAINPPKTDAGRRKVPINQKVKDALIREKERQQKENITCNSVIDGYTDFIFLNRFGEVQHQGTLNKALRRIVRDCNEKIIVNSKKNEKVTLVPKISNHILRHTFVTRMNEANINPKVTAQIVGHSEARITLNVYTDVYDEMITSEMSAFNEHFGLK